MMRRRLPPLNPLRVFEAAARHIHFTRAAEELGITQAAVSRQISTLERWLKINLFERRHTELRLTAAGSHYLESVRQAFDLIDESTDRVLSGSVKSRIVLRSYATFALLWLVPRLPRFREKYPDLSVDVLTSVAAVEVQREPADLIITYGVAEPEGVIAQRLFADVIAPVCSPLLLSKGERLRDVTDLRRFILLHSRYRPDDWSEWLAHADVDFRLESSLVFGSSILTYQAAKEGIGIAMGQLRLLEADLVSGALMRPLDGAMERTSGYFLLHSKRALHDERVTRLRDWIVEEAKRPALSDAALT
jgi:LysR family transcriptional regulator, glycine cleavage system transcriptional activator